MSLLQWNILIWRLRGISGTEATPKKILQLMEYKPEGLTLGQVKSHLQMHRKPAKEPSGLSEESTPRSDQRQSQSHRVQPQGTSVTSLQLGQPKSGVDEMAEIPLIEGAAALLQLKEDSGRSADAAGESGNLLGGSPSEHIESMQTVEKLDLTSEIFSAEGDEECVQTVGAMNMEHDFRQQGDPGSSSNCQQTGRRPFPSFGSFFGEIVSTSGTSSSTPVDVTKSSLSGCKRIAEEGIELELTMATRSRVPNFQFASPSTQEEADLDLALA